MFAEFFYLGKKSVEKGSIQIEIGDVISTDQRSDTRVYGKSSTFVYNGHGGGGGYVNSEVTVNRDIFYVVSDGAEKHLRLQFDCPIRTGHVIAVVNMFGSNGVLEHSLLFVSNLRKWWYLKDKNETFEKIFDESIFGFVDEACSLLSQKQLTGNQYKRIQTQLSDCLASYKDSLDSDFSAQVQALAEKKSKQQVLLKKLAGVFVVLLGVWWGGAFVVDALRQESYRKQREENALYHAKLDKERAEQAKKERALAEAELLKQGEINRRESLAPGKTASNETALISSHQPEHSKFKPILGRWVGSLKCPRSPIEVDLVFSMQGLAGEERGELGIGQVSGRWHLFPDDKFNTHSHFSSFIPTELGRRYQRPIPGVYGQLDGDLMYAKSSSGSCSGTLRRVPL